MAVMERNGHKPPKKKREFAPIATPRLRLRCE
jgi:hypothetical protein